MLKNQVILLFFRIRIVIIWLYLKKGRFGLNSFTDAESNQAIKTIYDSFWICCINSCRYGMFRINKTVKIATYQNLKIIKFKKKLKLIHEKFNYYNIKFLMYFY